jgi:shikimate dehydrogenase
LLKRKIMKEATITGKTKVCGIIGDPVEHSVSPVMHNAAYHQLGLDYIYLPFRVKKDKLSKAIDGMRALSIKGLNVTIPHKAIVIPFLDRVDPLALKMGAVNTIVNDGGELTGYNTDAEGFMKSLLEKGVSVQGKKAAIVGAGGVARSIAFALMEKGTDVRIHNRSPERAMQLARELMGAFNRRVEIFPLEKDSLKKSLESVNLLINATNVGTNPEINDTPVPSELLNSGLVIFDVVYNPLQTRLLRDGEAAGAMTIHGIDMLVFQGAVAFEKFTGYKAPVGLMKEKAIKQLGK